VYALGVDVDYLNEMVLSQARLSCRETEKVNEEDIWKLRRVLKMGE
jgi:hypothetical protein